MLVGGVSLDTHGVDTIYSASTLDYAIVQQQ